MEFIQIESDRIEELWALHLAYKEAIGEETPGDVQRQKLLEAIRQKQISFYGCLCEGALVACCSVCVTYSTFHYGRSGLFEDFYICPAYRHRGIARRLAAYAYEQSRVDSLLVGCADCDVEMYKAIGFAAPLGRLLAYEKRSEKHVPID